MSIPHIPNMPLCSPSQESFVTHMLCCSVRHGCEDWSNPRDKPLKDRLKAETRVHELLVMCGRQFFGNIGFVQ